MFTKFGRNGLSPQLTSYAVGAAVIAAVVFWAWKPHWKPTVVAEAMPTASEIRRNESSPSPAATRLSPATTLPTASTKPASEALAQATTAPTEYQIFEATMFDSSDERLPARYAEKVELTDAQTAELIASLGYIEGAEKGVTAMYTGFINLHDRITSQVVRDELYQRIADRKGFKRPGLPQQWTKYRENGAPLIDLPLVIQQGYFTLRVNRVKDNIVAGTQTVGDLKFAKYASDYLALKVVEYYALTQNAENLEQYLIDEEILRPTLHSLLRKREIFNLNRESSEERPQPR